MTPEEQTTITKGLDALTEQLKRVNAALEELLKSLDRKERSADIRKFLEGRAEERYYETGKWPGETK